MQFYNILVEIMYCKCCNLIGSPMLAIYSFIDIKWSRLSPRAVRMSSAKGYAFFLTKIFWFCLKLQQKKDDVMSVWQLATSTDLPWHPYWYSKFVISGGFILVGGWPIQFIYKYQCTRLSLFVPFPSRNHHFDVWFLKHDDFYFQNVNWKHENRKF